MSKLLSHIPALSNVVRRVAVEAGEMVLSEFEEGMMCAFDEKTDGTPVTNADRAAEHFITQALMADFSDIPVIGEEAVSLGHVPDLSKCEYFWLVDPLDGTREFISGGKDFTVNIALMKNGQPYLGVIHAPAYAETYYAHPEGGAMRVNEENGHEKEVRVRKPSRGGLIVITSKNRAHADVDAYLEGHKVEKLVRKGSSLKLCAVASGKADLYPGFGQTCEWDIAAGHAILRAAGGDVVTLEGDSIPYGNRDKKFMNPKFLARSNYIA
jgi:3'(2'), 5'-bisphosphate nucleotidase